MLVAIFILYLQSINPKYRPVTGFFVFRAYTSSEIAFYGPVFQKCLTFWGCRLAFIVRLSSGSELAIKIAAIVLVQFVVSSYILLQKFDRLF